MEYIPLIIVGLLVSINAGLIAALYFLADLIEQGKKRDKKIELLIESLHNEAVSALLKRLTS